MHSSFSEIIGLWPTPAALAAEIGASPDRVRKWSARNSIPGEWFTAVVAAAKCRGWAWVTADLLAQIAAAKTAPSPDPVCDEDHIPATIQPGDAA